MVNYKAILSKDKTLLLAYDHGLEHGPSDFNLASVNPDTVLNLALEAGYNGVVLHQGVAEKYYHGPYKEVPLILKLNGKTKLSQLNPVSRQICSVDRAIKLGAQAVGYTIYDGSPSESVMFQEFGGIVEKAHDYGLPVIAWMHPKGPDIRDESSTELLAYSARLALELGADFVVLKYNDDPQGFNWACRCAGACKVLVSGGERRDDEEVLRTLSNAVSSGASGAVVGRNAWQHPNPFKMTRALKKVLFQKASAEEALAELV